MASLVHYVITIEYPIKQMSFWPILFTLHCNSFAGFLSFLNLLLALVCIFTRIQLLVLGLGSYSCSIWFTSTPVIRNSSRILLANSSIKVHLIQFMQTIFQSLFDIFLPIAFKREYLQNMLLPGESSIFYRFFDEHKKKKRKRKLRCNCIQYSITIRIWAYKLQLTHETFTKVLGLIDLDKFSLFMGQKYFYFLEQHEPFNFISCL